MQSFFPGAIEIELSLYVCSWTAFLLRLRIPVEPMDGVLFKCFAIISQLVQDLKPVLELGNHRLVALLSDRNLL